MKEIKAMWLLNPGTADVSLSDLGLKVPAGKTINVYSANPYLTEERVSSSKKTGSLAKRLDSGIIKIVKGPPEQKVNPKKQIDISKIVTAKKTKSSVVIEADKIESEDGNFKFADYGLGDLNPAKLERQDNSVVVKAKDDKPEELKTTDVKSLVENLKQKGEDVVKTTAIQEEIPNSVAILVKEQPKEVETEKAPFSVADPKESKEHIEVKEISKNSDGAIVVGDNKPPARSLKDIKSGKIVSDIDFLDGEDSADKVIVDEAPKKEGMRVATKNKDGAIIMKINKG